MHNAFYDYSQTRQVFVSKSSKTIARKPKQLESPWNSKGGIP